MSEWVCQICLSFHSLAGSFLNDISFLLKQITSFQTAVLLLFYFCFATLQRIVPDALFFFSYSLKSPVPKSFRAPGSFAKLFSTQKQRLRNSDGDSLLNRSTQWPKCKVSDQITTLLIHQTSTPQDSC